jgi:hypothetical protein
MQRWEYLQVYVDVEELEVFQEKLDEYGENSWELVSMMPIQTKHWLANDAETSGLLAVFKRQKEK